MNSWLLLRRLRGPAFIILVGVTALLDQWGILRFSRSWPLYLIVAGLLGLVERLLLAGSPSLPPAYPSYPNYGPVSGYGQPPSAVSPAQPVILNPAGEPERRS